MANNTTTNNMLLEFMKSFKIEINAGNAMMTEKINDKIEKIEKKINMKIDKHIESISVKIDTIDENIEKLKRATNENKTEACKMNERMNKRIDEIEKEMMTSREIRKRTMALKQKEKMLNDQPCGRMVATDQPSIVDTNVKYSSDWAKQLAALENDKALNNATMEDSTELETEATPAIWMEREEGSKRIENDWFDNAKGEKEKQMKSDQFRQQWTMRNASDTIPATRKEEESRSRKVKKSLQA